MQLSSPSSNNEAASGEPHWKWPPQPWLWPRAAYVHVRFCAHHCCYCDFAVAAGRDEQTDRYLEALVRELAAVGEPRAVSTLFLGGGTPTHLTPLQLARLLESLRAGFLLVPEWE